MAERNLLNTFGAPLDIQNLPDPALGAGEAIVDVAAAGVTSYAAAVFDGSRNYLLELPVADMGAQALLPGHRDHRRDRTLGARIMNLRRPAA